MISRAVKTSFGHFGKVHATILKNLNETFMNIAFVYPGQGSQVIGMAQNLYNNFDVAKNVLDSACVVLNQDLKKIMFEGPTDLLTFTENTQPALLAASLMAQKVLETELGQSIVSLAKAVAGHSLGEYSALTAAGCFSLEDAIMLVKLRGNAMQSAVPVGQGAMAAILGLDMNQVERLLQTLPADDGVAQIANDNSPGQIVVSGHFKTIEWIIEKAKEMGAKRALPLPVSAPFHSSLMLPAATIMDQALSAVEIYSMQVPVYANVTANICSKSDVHDLLVQQITGRVRWVELITNMANAGIDTFVEIGTGKVLSGLIKRILPETNVYNFGKADELDTIKRLWV
jgi:[acyl-carrier-protein] S-malonyltransferase